MRRLVQSENILTEDVTVFVSVIILFFYLNLKKSVKWTSLNFIERNLDPAPENVTSPFARSAW